MKKLLLLFAAVVLVSCSKDNTETYPQTISFEEYSLAGYSGKWITEYPDTGVDPMPTNVVEIVKVINSNEELRKVIYEGDYPPVDFSKKTIIAAFGLEEFNVDDGKLTFQQNSKRSYAISIGLQSSDTARWQIAIVVDKLSEDVEVKLVTVKPSPTTRSASSDFYWSNGKQIPLQRAITTKRGETTINFSTQGYDNVGLTGKFFVELKETTRPSQLEQLAQEHALTVLKDEFLDGWYTLSCTEATAGNALDMANLFYESELFKESCPDFVNAGHLNCLNESMFDQGLLWHLGNNQDSPDIHINYCNARAIVPQASSNIVVAIVDGGVATNHFDIPNVLSGWDAHSGIAPNVVSNDHGTMVAGLIGATPNNNNVVLNGVAGGIAGVAHGITILPVSFKTTASGSILSSAEVMKNAINYAAARADVINCSWGFSEHPIIGAAISNAISNGCVVVFSAGNGFAGGPGTNQLNYPARSDSRILTVGAIDSYGERGYFSHYGSDLDVVAPGVDIFSTTTTTTTGVVLGSGTSYAAPIVSSIAALMLSVNPNLTSAQVSDIIETTAQELSAHPATQTKENGPWNSNVGYGLVDAYEAVAAVVPGATPIVTANMATMEEWDSVMFSIRNPQSGATYEWDYVGDTAAGSTNFPVLSLTLPPPTRSR